MTARYESPEVTIVLSKEEVQRRYQDTAMIIFKVRKREKRMYYIWMYNLNVFLNRRSSRAERGKSLVISASETVAGQWSTAITEIIPLSYANLRVP